MAGIGKGFRSLVEMAVKKGGLSDRRIATEGGYYAAQLFQGDMSVGEVAKQAYDKFGAEDMDRILEYVQEFLETLGRFPEKVASVKSIRAVDPEELTDDFFETMDLTEKLGVMNEGGPTYAGLGSVLRKGVTSLIAKSPKLVDDIYTATKANGGFTGTVDGTPITEGFSVSLQPYDQAIRAPMSDEEAVKKAIEQGIERSKDRGLKVGTWVDEGEIYVDVVDVFDDKDKAIAIAIENGQDGIADLGKYAKGEDGFISTKGLLHSKQADVTAGPMQTPFERGVEVAKHRIKSNWKDDDWLDPEDVVERYERFQEHLKNSPDDDMFKEVVEAYKELIEEYDAKDIGEAFQKWKDDYELNTMFDNMGVNKGGYMNKGRKVPVKLTRGEIVLAPDVTDRNLAVLERMNEIGLQARAMGGVAAYKAAGGMVRHFQEGGQTSFGDWANENSDAIGQVGNFLYKSAYNDPNAIDAFKPIDRKDTEDKGKDEELKQLEKIIQLATSARDKVDIARPALKVAQNAAAFFTKAGNLLSGVGASYGAALAAGEGDVAKQILRDYQQASVRNAVEAGEITQESATAYTTMVADITDLTTVALAAQGSGPKTDFDFVVAARATADLQSTPETIKASMQRIINNAETTLGREASALPDRDPNTLSLKERAAINKGNTTFSDEPDPYTNSLIAPLAQPSGDPDLDNEKLYPRPRRIWK